MFSALRRTGSYNRTTEQRRAVRDRGRVFSAGIQSIAHRGSLHTLRFVAPISAQPIWYADNIYARSQLLI